MGGQRRFYAPPDGPTLRRTPEGPEPGSCPSFGEGFLTPLRRRFLETILLGSVSALHRFLRMVSWKAAKNKSLGANLAAGVSWGSRNHDVGCLISWPHVFDRKFVAARFIPEGEFDPIPESEFVVDDAQVV